MKYYLIRDANDGRWFSVCTPEGYGPGKYCELARLYSDCIHDLFGERIEAEAKKMALGERREVQCSLEFVKEKP